MKSSLTVLQVLPALSSGGVERGTQEMAAYLVSQGHRALVISAGGRMLDQLLAQGAEHITWAIGKKSLLTLRYVFHLRRLFLTEHIDIVHVRSRFPAWIVYWAWRTLPKGKRPVLITTVHGCYSVSFYSQVMTNGEAVIAVSESVKAYILNNYPIDQNKLKVIHRGVDTHAFSHAFKPDDAWIARWHEDFPQTCGKKILVLPARITRWKGHEDFIRMLQIIKLQRQDIHALIVGETSQDKAGYFQSLKTQIEDLGLSTMISFTGHRTDLKEIMAISDIVYSLSKSPEAFGRTTIEALSLGVPVIGYQHGGVAEQLSALLPEGAVMVGNVAEAALLTLHWLDNKPTVRENTQFTLAQMCQRTLDVYVAALRKREEG